MTVGMITSWQERCGIAAYTGELVEALSARVEVRVIAPPRADASDAALDAVAEAANACDLVHVQHEYSFFNGVLPGATTFLRFADRLRRPMVLTAHSVIPIERLLRLDEERRPLHYTVKRLLASWPPYRNALERDPYRRAAEVIVHTLRCRDRLLWLGVPKDRLHWIPAGIPTLPPPGELPAGVREFLNRSTLAMVGYVSPNKGYDVALEALERMPEHVRLLIAGGTRVPAEQPVMDALLAEISRRGLEERVMITGYLEEETLAAVLARVAVVLVPHRTATGSYSVTLPLAAGRAIVASDLPCFRELLDPGPCLLLVPPGDAGALAERTLWLLEDPVNRRSLEAMARSRAAGRTWSAVADRTLAVYDRALAGGRCGTADKRR